MLNIYVIKDCLLLLSSRYAPTYTGWSLAKVVKTNKSFFFLSKMGTFSEVEKKGIRSTNNFPIYHKINYTIYKGNPIL